LNNTAKRIIVSAIAIPLIVAACYLGKIYFFIFASIIALVSFQELSVMVKNKGANVNLVFGLIAVFILLANQFQHFLDNQSLLLLIVIFAVIFELFSNNGSPVLNIGSTLLGIFYIGLFSASLISIREFYPNVGYLYNWGGYLIISILATIWICDSAAFFLGVAYGKHKMFPRVSPKKSWEGTISGFIFAIITMVAAHFIVLDFLSLKDSILIGAIIGIIGQVGDLVESLLKRDCEVKDSSSLVPGHGGIFDRFDSLLLSAPVILLYLKYFGR